MKELAYSLFEQWNQALLIGEKAVARLYKQDALLLPTISSEFCNTPTKIKKYFSIFCQKKPQGKIIDSRVIHDKQTLIIAGHYLFFLEHNQETQARFTFIFEKVKESNEKKLGSDWLIAHHHSSVFP